MFIFSHNIKKNKNKHARISRLLLSTLGPAKHDVQCIYGTCALHPLERPRHEQPSRPGGLDPRRALRVLICRDRDRGAPRDTVDRFLHSSPDNDSSDDDASSKEYSPPCRGENSSSSSSFSGSDSDDKTSLLLSVMRLVKCGS